MSTSSDMQQQRGLRVGVLVFACIGSPIHGIEDGVMSRQSLGDANGILGGVPHTVTMGLWTVSSPQP